MPKRKAQQVKNPADRYELELHKLRAISFAAITLSVISLTSLIAVVFVMGNGLYGRQPQPAPTTTVSPFGHTLAGIDQPLNASSLAVINNGPNAYFQKAGEEYINGTLSNPIFASSNLTQPFLLDNKTSVLYLGSITCIFCGENRWAMALALSRFGSFSRLYMGYSSFGDYDVPTLYWTPVDYNASGDSIGNYYSSNVINFISIEDTNPITGSFKLNSFAQMQSNVEAYGNQTYDSALSYIMGLGKNSSTAFQGTPYTIWGDYLFKGADSEDFGNTTPTGSTLQLTYMTHGQVLSQLADPTDQFALTEYAAADVYVAAICKSINNTAAVCSLPAIVEMETAYK